MTTPPPTCSHCKAMTRHSSWRLIEVYPERTYEMLCLRCQARQASTFTEEQAIAQALITIGLYQGRLAAQP